MDKDILENIIFDITDGNCIVQDEDGNILFPSEKDQLKKTVEILSNKTGVEETFESNGIWYKHSELIKEHNGKKITIKYLINVSKYMKQVMDLSYDQKTGLPIAETTYEFIDKYLQKVRGRDRQFACMYLDADKFKDINDKYGHAAGNKVLEVIGKLLQGTIREEDIAGRIGGDEFFVLLKDISETNAILKAMEIKEKLNKIKIVYKDQVITNLTTSIGVCYINSKEMNFDTPEELVAFRNDMKETADEAMYTSKNDGGNSITFVYYHNETKKPRTF